ncbi:ABC-F family ATP-binding cassette domain-containing protein [Rikenella microfusus]|uniref:ABC-F family ATP-binding cassette domain-containing protein n=1 Tax=Rikenella microfusus TaxID=28139 RepID=UPI001D8F4241|nr:ABC-F family ATP-binding cassette domain-containing protein [Rikenella microfusus]HJE87487.1 ABC-F family ATP-binding cassette domain-containing protein [Rikenella microfusus]
MAIHMQVSALTKSFGERVLFENISFGIAEGQRIGLIAANGTGKTTLLNIIAGRMDYDSGEVVFRRDLSVGYLEQDPRFPAGLTVLEACFHGQNEIVRTIARYEQALARNDTAAMDGLLARMEALGAWDFEQRAKQILTRLRIADLEQRVETLSGGQLKRVALAAALIVEPDLLILDEPTNHLDLEMTEWLEEYLAGRRMSLLMVTHDRYFLDRVCNEIIEIDDRRLYSYKGNYSYYLEKRQERLDAADATVARMKNLYRRELEWIRRTPSARSGKAKYRIDAFQDIKDKAHTRRSEETVQLDVRQTYIGKKIFEAQHLCKRFGDRVILDDFSYLFSRYEKMGIVGNNGTGKSTFIKILLGLETADSGTIDIGETVRFGYYSQQGMEFAPQARVIDIVTAIAEHITLSDGKQISASQLLTRFLFSPQAQYDYVAKLSGGERRRLYLCTILMSNPNFLVLDEPTNDLDIRTLNVLEEYLSAFSGCLIVVSHDRYFMDKVADHLLVFNGQGNIRDFPGSYTDYRTWRKEQEAAAAQGAAKTVKPAAVAPTTASKPKERVKGKLSFNEKREFERLEAEIPELEAEKAALETEMSSGTLSTEELIAKSERIAALIEEIDAKSMRWLELSEL